MRNAAFPKAAGRHEDVDEGPRRTTVGPLIAQYLARVLTSYVKVPMGIEEEPRGSVQAPGAGCYEFIDEGSRRDSRGPLVPQNVVGFSARDVEIAIGPEYQLVRVIQATVACRHELLNKRSG